MATSDDFPPSLQAFFVIFYSTFFFMSFSGNLWMIVTCYKSLKRQLHPLIWLLANLAFADLLFTFLIILVIYLALKPWTMFSLYVNFRLHHCMPPLSLIYTCQSFFSYYSSALHDRLFLLSFHLETCFYRINLFMHAFVLSVHGYAC